MSLAEVYPETPKVSFGYDRTPSSVIFSPNNRALADAMFELMDQLGEVEDGGVVDGAIHDFDVTC